MKILHYLWSPGIGGIERFVLDLALTQSDRSDSTIAVGFGQGKGLFLEKFQTPHINLFDFHLSSGYDLSPSKLLRMRSILDDYDIVHVHSFHPALLFSRKSKKTRYIFTAHGLGGYRHITGLREHIKYYMLSFFFNFCCDYIIYNSNFTRQFVEDHFYTSRLRTTVIFNGTRFSSTKAHDDTAYKGFEEACRGKFVIGTVGRLIDRKRFDRLIYALAKSPFIEKFVALIVGDGPCRQKLEDLVKELRIHSHVIFTGMKQNIEPYYELMDVCVFPSYGEGFGLVALEALAAGKPTIIFQDGGGLVEIVEPLRPEDMVADIDQLCARFEYYYNKKENLNNVKQENARYIKRFDIHLTEDLYYNIYRSLLNLV